MFAPHWTLLSGFVCVGYDVSVEYAALEQLKQKRKKSDQGQNSLARQQQASLYKQRKPPAFHPSSQQTFTECLLCAADYAES